MVPLPSWLIAAVQAADQTETWETQSYWDTEHGHYGEHRGTEEAHRVREPVSDLKILRVRTGEVVKYMVWDTGLCFIQTYALLITDYCLWTEVSLMSMHFTSDTRKAWQLRWHGRVGLNHSKTPARRWQFVCCEWFRRMPSSLSSCCCYCPLSSLAS